MKAEGTILVVDDDEDILRSVKRFLEAKGFAVITAQEASSAYLIAQEARPGLILSDSDMPGMDGHKLCRILKKDQRTAAIPVILMSGVWISEKDQISGLEGGADDYVNKPFSLPMLLARIQAVLRRFEAPGREEGEILESCGLSLDPSARTATIRGKPVRLTAKEFDLLTLFMQKPGRVLKPSYLLEAVWGYDPADYNDPHTVEVHVSSLRKKLGPQIGKRLVNVIGFGYKFERRELS